MGSFADFFLGKKCPDCGSRSLEEYRTFRSSRGGTIRMMWCRSCHRVRADESWHIPRCYRCGTRQTASAKNEYGVIVPKCPHCGLLYDGEEYGD